VTLAPSDRQLPFASETKLRRAAVETARFACNGEAGRVLGDPVFEIVTEGRNHWRGYSACGDLAHYVLRELGYRDEAVLNRNDDGGTVPWRIGKNLARLVFASGKAFIWARNDRRPEPGDILYVAPPEHVAVLESIDEAAGKIATFDYGQWDSKAQKPLGIRKVSRFAVKNGSLHVGSRVLRGWLDIARLPGLLTPSA
jgi:hypothetical protein